MEFSVGAYRVGHSMIPNNVGDFTLPSLFFNRQLIIDNGIEPFLQGAIGTNAQKADHFIVNGLRNFLFSAGPNIIGEDLSTRNLFRGRELGIGTYGQILSCYGDIPPTAVDTPLSTENYLAMLKEPLMEGSSLPLTMGSIIAEQFARLRDYDPNYYEKKFEAIGYDYYIEVQATTLATVIKMNTGLANVKANVFYK